jgi:hypothetical protein
MSAEVVLESRPGASIDVYLRFLQVQSRVVQRHTAGGWEPADELLVGGTRWIPFHEAVPRELTLRAAAVDRGSPTPASSAPSGPRTPNCQRTWFFEEEAR